MKLNIKAFGWVMAALLASGNTVGAPTGDEAEVDAMLQNIDSLWFGERTYAEISMHIVTAHYERELKMHAWGEGKKKSLIRIVEPAREKGVSTLKVGDDVYNYLPKVARTIKLSQALMAQSWMGSHFLNSDLVRATHLKDNYHSRLLEKKHPAAASEQWLVEALAKDDAVTPFKRIIITIDHKTRLPLMQEYFDQDKKLIRTISYLEVRDLGGKPTPSRMRLTPLDEGHKGEFTELTYDKIDRQAKLDKHLFELTNLTNL